MAFRDWLTKRGPAIGASIVEVKGGQAVDFAGKVTTGAQFGQSSLTHGDARLEAMDRMGIGVQVLAGWVDLTGYEYGDGWVSAALALFVLFQDYRFLLLDAFLRFLANILFAAGFSLPDAGFQGAGHLSVHRLEAQVAGEDDELAPGHDPAGALVGLAAHEHMVAHGEAAEMFEVVGEVPGQPVVAADAAALVYRGDEGD